MRQLLRQTKMAESLPENISVAALVQIIETLPNGITELSCHPAAKADTQLTYDIERITELETLCDPGIREVLKRCGVELRSF